MHVASLVGMLLFLYLITDSLMAGGGVGGMAFLALVGSVVFNTMFVLIEGLVWARKMERETLLALAPAEEQTPIIIIPVKHTWMN